MTREARSTRPPSSLAAGRVAAARVLAAALVVGACALAAGCRAAGTRNRVESSAPMPRPPIAEGLARHTPELTRSPGVVGTGEGRRDGAPVVLVLVERSSPELEARLPRALEAYAVEIRETGRVRAIGDR